MDLTLEQRLLRVLVAKPGEGQQAGHRGLWVVLVERPLPPLLDRLVLDRNARGEADVPVVAPQVRPRDLDRLRVLLRVI